MVARPKLSSLILSHKATAGLQTLLPSLNKELDLFEPSIYVDLSTKLLLFYTHTIFLK